MSLKSIINGVEQVIPIPAPEVQVLDLESNYESNDLENVLKEIHSNKTNILNELGNETLETTAQTLKGAINENTASLLEKVYYFDNVENMKAYNLKNGDYVTTTGYYTLNDGGNAEYIIRTKNDGEIADSGKTHLLNNGLIAELVIKGKVNILQLGCKDEVGFDNYSMIQNILDNFSEILIPNKRFFISQGLTITKSTNIVSNNGCIYITPDLSITPITINADNVKINGLEIDGMAEFIEPNDYTSTEYNTARSNNLFCIYILDSSHVEIKNCYVHNNTQGIVTRNSSHVIINSNYVKDTLADGIYVSDASQNVKVINNTLENTGDDSLACVSVKASYNLSDLQTLSGFSTSLSYSSVLNLIATQNPTIIPFKSFSQPCKDVTFENNTVTKSWNSGFKAHGGNRVSFLNNKISECYSWGANVFFADRGSVSGNICYYTFDTSIISVSDNIFDEILKLNFKTSDLGLLNFEGVTDTKINNNYFKISTDTTFANPLARIANALRVDFSNNEILNSKIFSEYSDTVKIQYNIIINSNTTGINCSNCTNIDINNNRVQNFNKNNSSWIYGISATGSVKGYNVNISGNTIITSNIFQGNIQVQNIENVYIDIVDVYKRDTNTDISLLGRFNNSVNIKTGVINAKVVPPVDILQFISGTFWFNELTNILYVFTGTVWTQFNIN